MPRKQNPQRGESLRRYIASDGKITIDELATAAGVDKRTISKWKCEDKWNEKLKNKPKKRGGQPGNKNAAGSTPAKQGNKNAVTHGAFAQAGYEDIPPEEAERIKNMTGDSLQNMAEELQALMLRKVYLESLLKEYTAPEAEDKYHIDKIVHMVVPKSLEDIQAEQDAGIEAGEAQDPEQTQEQMKTAMKTIIKASSFDRAMKVEAELNKLHGRILKLLDSMKSYEMESRRLELEQRKYELAKQRLTGEIEINDEVEEIIDELTDSD